ncbi:MAG: sterol desaturase family protein [Pseudobdellovibrionaceae bacterium]
MEHYENIHSYLPTDLNQFWFFGQAVVVIIAVVLFRYFLITGFFWLVFYRWRPGFLKSRQIYNELPSAGLQLYEIKMSVLTGILFGLTGAVWGWLWQNGYTKIYLQFNQYGWLYFFASGFIVSLLHELYFYWTHRWLHHPWAFRRFHAAHHESLTPSPWASFSFHPVEGLIQALALPLISLFIPVHPLVLLTYLTVMTLSAVGNHLGFELMPRQWGARFFSKTFISGTHHSQHHRFYKYNYGLFYTFSDVIFRTEHPDYKKPVR